MGRAQVPFRPRVRVPHRVGVPAGEVGREHPGRLPRLENRCYGSLEIRNPKPETRDPNPETRDPRCLPHNSVVGCFTKRQDRSFVKHGRSMLWVTLPPPQNLLLLYHFRA